MDGSPGVVKTDRASRSKKAGTGDHLIPAERADDLVATAARAPSIHNTQPWRFRVSRSEIELHADRSRELRMDRAGREMLISCGAALFGLRLAVRNLGRLPVVELFPDPDRPCLLAVVRLGAAAPITSSERRLLAAIPHRHTHRGPFEPGRMPAALVAALRRHALAERASLTLISRPGAYQRLTALVAAAARERAADPVACAETRRWSRQAGSPASDGVPARAFPATAVPRPGRLPQRDFDLGRGLGQLMTGGPPPAATAVLTTAGDSPADWLRAGQALHRVLAHAASRWVFASLHSEPLESAEVRALIRAALAVPGHPQMLLQFGPARTTRPTRRRPAAELLIES